MESKINDTNELTYKTERDSQKMNSWLLREGTVKDIGKVTYTLLYFKWITIMTYCIAQGTLLSFQD